MCASIVAGADPAPIFDAAEHVLDAVALPVEFLIVGHRCPTAARRWNARRDAAFDQSGAELVAVVAWVAEHAILRVSGGERPVFTLVDLASGNGTFVNGDRLSGERELLPGDAVEFGRGGPKINLV